MPSEDLSPEDPGPHAPVPPSAGIPDEPEGSAGRASLEFDEGEPVGPTPPMDFWRALYERRSVRKFRPDPVPRELLEQLMHAGIWAPSSCNYQMWDLVAVDDPELNRKLGALSLQMANAPVNIVVSYGRDFSEDGWANVQSASALIQNMSLAAQVLGLGTFWITQMGDREQVREVVGLPYDRLVIAVLAVGFPKHALKKGPRRRPLHHVAHWNHYAGRPIPSSPQPARWEPYQLALYQRARVLNGLRHNKPRAWETRALLAALDHCVPATRPSASGATPRWLDVLPCTGILTERIARERPGYALTVVERTGEVAEFCAARVRPAGEVRVWPPEQESQTCRGPEDGAFELITCLYRLEGLVPAERPELLAAMARWLAPGGRILLGYVSRASFHTAAERLRARRARLQGVEYVLSPDPNIGPFEALAPGAVEAACKHAGLRVSARLGLQIAPQPEEIAFRARNFRPRARKLAGALGAALGALERVPGLASARGRFRYLLLERA